MKILSVDHRWFERGIKEAIHIQTYKPSLNADRVDINYPGGGGGGLKYKKGRGARRLA